jgi:hypothetical protein
LRIKALKKILILTFSCVEDDPRVSRQVDVLSKHYALTVAGRSNSGIHGAQFIDIIPRSKSAIQKVAGALMLKTGRFEHYYWTLPDVENALAKLKGRQFDLVIANDVETLPLALKISPGAKLLLDAHEYAPNEFEDRRIWTFFARKYTTSFLCREHLSKVDSMTTVCESIADEYARNFNIPKPFVVLNAPRLQNLEPQPCTERIRLIHHGKAIPSRKLELMIEMMDHLDERFSLDFMIIGTDARYVQALARSASSNPRIRFRSPVPLQEIPRSLNGYDIGLFLLPPTNFNYAHALPNKFFEFIQARLAVAIGPSPEMARYVRNYACGIVSRDFTPQRLAGALNELKAGDIYRMKMNAHRAAKDLSFETSEKVLLDTVRSLLGN